MVDEFASIRVKTLLDTYDSRYKTYLDIDTVVRSRSGSPVTGAGLRKRPPRQKLAEKIVLALGAPESGRETTCAKLAKEYGFTQLCVDGLLRAEIDAETPTGLHLMEDMEEGIPIETEVLCSVVKAAMAKVGAEGGSRKFLLDWFPRDVREAKAFDDLVAGIDFVLFFDVDPMMSVRVEGCYPVLREREPKEGDEEDLLRRQFEAFAASRAPVLNYFKGEGMAHHLRWSGTEDGRGILETEAREALAVEKVEPLPILTPEESIAAHPDDAVVDDLVDGLAEDAHEFHELGGQSPRFTRRTAPSMF